MKKTTKITIVIAYVLLAVGVLLWGLKPVFAAVQTVPWFYATTTSSIYPYPNPSLKVGIGTTTPYSPLSVVGQVVAANYVATTSASNTFVGAVGIGTTSPYATLSIKGSGASTGVTLSKSDSNGRETLISLDNGKTIINADPLSFASSSPAFPLSVLGGNDAVGVNRQLFLGGGSSGLGYSIGRNNSTGYLDITATQGSSFGINITNGNAQFASIPTAAGNNLLTQYTSSIGIGTSGDGSPDSALHINGAGTAAAQRIKISAAGAPTIYYTLGRNVSTGYMDFFGSQTGNTGYTFTVRNGTEAFRIDDGQNIGVSSSTPYARLSVKGAGTGTGVNFQTTNSSNAPLVTMLDNGNVGVGTTTPHAKLSVMTGSVTGDIFSSATTTQQPLYAIDQNGHNMYGGNKPACDGNCTFVAGNDNRFRVAFGAVKTTATVTFAKPYGPLAPICLANEGSAGVAAINASSTPTTVVLTTVAALSNVDIEVFCDGIF